MKDNKTVLFFTLNTTAAILLSSAALAQTSYYEADVIESSPIYRNVEVSSPHEECWQEEVVRYESRHQRRSRTSGLLGAVVGGAIGNAVGHHNSNKKVGTVIGAVLGGSIGSDIGRKHQVDRESGRYYETVERCKTVYDYRQQEKLVGYDVLYRYNGSDYSIRMPEDPGRTVSLRVNIEPML